VVTTIFQKIVDINKELWTTILLVEQNARMALSIAHYGYVMETGEIRLHAQASELTQNEDVRKSLPWREVILSLSFSSESFYLSQLNVS